MDSAASSDDPLPRGVTALEQGRYREAEEHFEAARDAAERRGDVYQTAVALAWLADTLFYQNQYERSERCILHALRLFRASAAPDNDVALALLRQSAIVGEQGNLTEAERLCQESLDRIQGKHPPDHPRVARHLHALGALYQTQGRYFEAKPLLLRAQVSWRRAGAAYRTALAQSLAQLASLYQREGRLPDCLPLLYESLELLEQQLGPEHHLVGRQLYHLGHVLLRLDVPREQEAAECLHRAARIIEQQLGPDHSDLLGCLDEMAELAAKAGRFHEAEQYLERSLAIVDRVFGPNSSDRGQTLARLAQLQATQGRYETAEVHYLEALRCLRTSMGLDHPILLPVMANLAWTYVEQQRLEQAEALYRRAIAQCEELLGPDHPRMVNLLLGAATVLRDTGRRGEAAQMLRRARQLTSRS